METLNWVKAAQAIEDGHTIEWYRRSFDDWCPILGTKSVTKGEKYRIKPREFTQGWYEYDLSNKSGEGIYKQIIFYSGSAWQTIQNFTVHEELVGRKIQ